MKRTAQRLVPALLLPMALLACGEGGQTDGADTAAAEADTAATDTAARSGSIQLQAKNNSGITGTAHTERAAGDSAVLVLQLDGLEQGEQYPAHVHRGTCEAGGPVAVGLTAVSGETGTSRTTVAPAQFADTVRYFIQVHLPGGTPAACVNVPAAAPGSASGGQQGAGSGGEAQEGGSGGGA